MEKGWIKFEDELPLIGENIVFAYPMIAYGGHISYAFGKRVNETQIENYVGNHGEVVILPKKWNVLMFKDENDPYKTYATHWALDNGQELPTLCNLDCCKKDGIRLIKLKRNTNRID